MVKEQKTIRKLSAILSADVKGYSLLMTRYESFTINTLKAYRKVMSAIVERHYGRVVDAPGDNILAEFPSAVEAVQCAVDIQKALKEKNSALPDDKQLAFRIGVNIGDVVQDDDRLYGEGVNIAARIEGLADTGGVSISRNAYDQIKNRLDLGYEYIGEHRVKNIKDPVRVYKVLLDPKDAGKRIGDEPRSQIKSWVWPTLVIATFILTMTGYQVFQKITAPEFEQASVENMAYTTSEKPSIAVLPFENMSDDPQQEYFSDGITEDLITALSKTSKLLVIARNSAFTYKNTPVSIQQIGNDLDVRYALTGSVRKSGEKVRITAQLIETDTGRHLWADNFDRRLKDIFQVQDDITKNIITELQIKLTEGEQARVYSKGTQSLDAYLRVMQAQYNSHLGTREGNIASRRLVEKAIAIDPGYAYAYRILGMTHVMDVFLGMSQSPKDSLILAVQSYKKAISLDSDLASAYAAMGYVHLMLRKHDEAVRLGKKALDLAPNSPEVLYLYAAILTYSGIVDEAVPLFRTALKLNPIPPNTYYKSFGHALRLSGQYDQAIALQRKAIEQERDDILAYVILAACANMSGRDREARDAAKEIIRIDPNFSVKRLIAPFKDRSELKRTCISLRESGLDLDCESMK